MGTNLIIEKERENEIGFELGGLSQLLRNVGNRCHLTLGIQCIGLDSQPEYVDQQFRGYVRLKAAAYALICGVYITGQRKMYRQYILSASWF